MPWTTPTLEEVRTQNRDAIVARLKSSALVPNSVLRVLADSNAGLAYLTLRYIDWLSRQLLPDTAESEWLHRHAQIWLGGWKQPTFATGKVAVTGNAGAIVPLATRFTGPGSPPLQFETTAQATIGGGTLHVDVIALQPGAASNLDAGTSLGLAEAISGVDGDATVFELAGGTEEESDEDLRARLLRRIRMPPMGGDADDYVQWALALPGVTRAWCAPLEMGIGTVTVRFMMDELRAGWSGFPLAEDIAFVKAALDEVRPVAVKDMFVVAPLPQPVHLTITGLFPDTDSVRQNIETALRAMIADRAAPAFARNGVLQDAQTIYASWASEAIHHAEGVEHFRLTMADAVMATPGHIAVLGNITYA